MAKCPRCHNELESDLKNAGASETCPICKMVLSVPGNDEWQQVQDAKRQEGLERERIKNEQKRIKAEKKRKAQEYDELLVKEQEARERAAEEEQRKRDEWQKELHSYRSQSEGVRPEQEQARNEFLEYEGTGTLTGFGALLLIGGLLCAAYFFFSFRTSVDTPVGQVNNLGLLNDRTGGIIIGMGLAVTGAVFIAVSSNRDKR
jgi:hypothetical protein